MLCVLGALEERDVLYDKFQPHICNVDETYILQAVQLHLAPHLESSPDVSFCGLDEEYN